MITKADPNNAPGPEGSIVDVKDKICQHTVERSRKSHNYAESQCHETDSAMTAATFQSTSKMIDEVSKGVKDD